MALEKIQIVDRIEVVDSGIVQVRTKTVITEDGNQISERFHRHIVAPGDSYAGENDRVQAICKATHTPEVIESYKAVTAASGV
jgi:hypothetical protein